MWKIACFRALGVGIVLVELAIAPATTVDNGYVPVGDRLFDKTADWALTQSKKYEALDLILALRYLLHGDLSNPAKEVRTDELLDWKAEFGADPRYWQLLLNSDSLAGAVTNLPYNAQETPFGTEDYISWLEGHDVEADSFGALSRNRWHGMDEERALQLAQQAIEVDPGNSFFYYSKADLLQTLGDLDGAWKAVKQGNAATENYLPEPFPRSAVRQHRRQFTTDDSRLAAVILWATNDNLGDGIMLKVKYKEVACACAWGMPPELADDYLIRAMQVAQQDNQSLAGQIPAMWSAIILLRYLPENCIDLDLRQQAERDAIERRLLEVQHNMEAAAAESQTAIGQSGLPEYTIMFMYEHVPEAWDDIVRGMQCAEDNKPLFDVLDPPPFAIWARGELVGIDTSVEQDSAGASND